MGSTRQFDFVTSVETSQLPTASTPSAADDTITKGYADETYTPLASYEATVTNITALKALDSSVTARVDNQSILVHAIDTFYYWSSTSTATPDDDVTVRPDDISGANPGRWIKREIVSGAAGGGGGGGDTIQDLLAQGEIRNSAYASGLSIAEGANNTEEGFTIKPEVSVDFDGVVVLETNRVLEIDTINASDVDCQDGRDRSGDFLSGDVVKVFREVTIDGEDRYIDTGVTKTLTGNASFSSATTNVPLDVSGLAVGDILYHEEQVTKEISFTSIGAGDSFGGMTLDSVEITETSGGLLAGVDGYWPLTETTTALVDSIGGNDLDIVGTLTSAAGNHLPGAITGFDGSNYVSNSSSQVLKTTPSGIFSFSLWFRTGASISTNTVVYGVFANNTVASSGEGWRVIIDTGPNLRLFGSGTQIVTSSNLSVSTWYHVVVTSDGTTKELYLNGASQGTGANGWNNVTSTGGLCIGSEGDGGGVVDSDLRFSDLQYYDTELTSGDVTSLYNSGFGLAGADAASAIHKYTSSGLTGQIIKSKVTVPSISANSDIVVSAHGVIRKS